MHCTRSTDPNEHRSGIQGSPKRRQRTSPQQILPNVACSTLHGLSKRITHRFQRRNGTHGATKPTGRHTANGTISADSHRHVSQSETSALVCPPLVETNMRLLQVWPKDCASESVAL